MCIDTYGTIKNEDVTFNFINYDDENYIFVGIDPEKENEYIYADNVSLDHDFVQEVLNQSELEFYESYENLFLIVDANLEDLESLKLLLLQNNWTYDPEIEYF